MPAGAWRSPVHHPLAWHMSPGNTTSQARCGWSITFLHPLVRWNPSHAPHPWNHRISPTQGSSLNPSHFPRMLRHTPSNHAHALSWNSSRTRVGARLHRPRLYRWHAAAKWIRSLPVVHPIGPRNLDEVVNEVLPFNPTSSDVLSPRDNGSAQSKSCTPYDKDVPSPSSPAVCTPHLLQSGSFPRQPSTLSVSVKGKKPCSI